MKVKIFKYAVIVLLFAVGIFSCSASVEPSFNGDENVIGSIIPNDDVTAFFEEHLPPYSGMESDCFFVDIDKKENRYVMINSVGEFKKNFSCSDDMLPVIDFASYTIIIGQCYYMGGTAYRVEEQNLTVESKKVKLNLFVRAPEASLAALTNLYYWGIYPKIKNKSISVNILFIEK